MILILLSFIVWILAVAVVLVFPAIGFVLWVVALFLLVWGMGRRRDKRLRREIEKMRESVSPSQ